MMKIAYFSSTYPTKDSNDYAYGGSVLATEHVVKEIVKRGHNINVFSTSLDSKDSVYTDGNLTVYRYATQIKVLSSNISLGVFSGPLESVADLVHVSFDLPPAPFAGWIYAMRKKIPMVVTYHGDWDGSYGGLSRKLAIGFFNSYLVDRLLSDAKAIISPSSSYINQSPFLSRYREKIKVVANGIDLDEWDIALSKQECRCMLGLPLDHNILLFCGHLAHHKGPDILLKALALALNEVPNTILVLAGKGVMKEQLVNLTHKMGIANHVRFIGYVNGDEKAIVFHAADVFCLPSLCDMFPLVNLEAMASGLPIVASNVGGVPDVVMNGVNGFLVNPGDYHQMARVIVDFLTQPSMRMSMGYNGQLAVRKYSWETIANEIENIYLDVQ